ncbi:uncharacterized protein LOC132607870 [Lycium barbarum]|uniref:uncharacterized protein LOC132607870 n=1 Tax=Lycium barbarum TaxID=112863 RepID=UPI00293EFFA0|nr:uncharacterized protein LOC132607870 [Lycium barbarum]
MIPGSTCAPVFNILETQYYAPELTLKVPESYCYTSQLKHLFKLENHVNTDDYEEKFRKMKSSMKNLQGLGGHRSVSYKDLCMFPNVHFPIDFKVAKFDKYDGHGDPMVHLKRYCNQLRGAGGKQELLMAYLGESLTGLASEWFIDQEFTKWYIWDDMAQEFVPQFQYNIDLVPDKKSLINLKKKTVENFGEFAIRWREQAARVRPPLKESEVVETFIQAHDEEYYQHMLPALGKSFVQAIKMGEMIEDRFRTGRIVSFPTFKSTTHASESWSRNIGIERDGNSDVVMIGSGQGQGTARRTGSQSGPAWRMGGSSNSMIRQVIRNPPGELGQFSISSSGARLKNRVYFQSVSSYVRSSRSPA